VEAWAAYCGQLPLTFRGAGPWSLRVPAWVVSMSYTAYGDEGGGIKVHRGHSKYVLSNRQGFCATSSLTSINEDSRCVPQPSCQIRASIASCSDGGR
jgi:hypothetical protein